MESTIITAPEVWKRNLDSLKGVFLAGGISNCQDWQTEVAEKLSSSINAVIINPRQENWNMDGRDDESIKQIVWEHSHLKHCDHILFWFPCETLCPITLFELGAHLHGSAQLHVGCHPDYQRKLDVSVQTKLVRWQQVIFDNLDEMVDDLIKNWTN